MTDLDLLAVFEAGAAPEGGLRHRDHVRLAWLYLQRYPLASVLERMSAGLRRLAAAAGRDGLYHETITWAYVFLVRERMAKEDPGLSWDAFAARHGDLLDWRDSILSRYYTRARLDSEAARLSFLLPDRPCGSMPPKSAAVPDP